MKRLLVALAVATMLCGASSAHADPTIAVVGDLACPAGASVAPTRCQQRSVSDFLLRRAPTRVLLAGDLQYASGTLAEYRGSYALTYGRLNPVVCAVPGNHEHVSAAQGFFDYFRSAGVAVFSGGRTCPVPGAPNWTIVGLDSGPNLGCSWASWQSGGTTTSCVAQTSYLKQRLAEAPSCEAVFWHHPRYTAEADDSPRVQPWVDAVYAGHGDLILNGHAHVYERFGVTNPYGVGDLAHGFRTIVAGTGGVNLRPFDKTPVPASQKRDDKHFGALFLTLHPASYDARFISTDGVVRDQLLNQPCHA